MVDIHENSARDVRLLVVGAPRDHVVKREIGQRRQMGGAVDDAHGGVVQVLSQPVGANQIFGMNQDAHVDAAGTMKSRYYSFAPHTAVSSALSSVCGSAVLISRAAVAGFRGSEEVTGPAPSFVL